MHTRQALEKSMLAATVTETRGEFTEARTGQFVDWRWRLLLSPPVLRWQPLVIRDLVLYLTAAALVCRPVSRARSSRD